MVKGLAGRRANKERLRILSLHYQNITTAFGREVRRPLCSPVATRGTAVASLFVDSSCWLSSPFPGLGRIESSRWEPKALY